MRFHIGAFCVGLILTVVIHHSFAAKSAADADMAEYFHWDDALIHEVQAQITREREMLMIMQASNQNLEKFKKSLRRAAQDLTPPPNEGEDESYYWTHQGLVQRMTCADSPEFSRPVLTPMTSRYGRRANPFNGKTHIHSGVDFRGEEGRPILASEQGIVSWADKKGRYGKTVVISHKNGFTTLYGHLTDYAVKLGDRVIKGQTIGYIGRTGRVTGPHLHFEVRCFNVPVNPMVYLEKKGKKALVSVIKKRQPQTLNRLISRAETRSYPSARQQIVSRQKQASAKSLIELRSRAF